jgi:hypothetical protein
VRPRHEVGCGIFFRDEKTDGGLEGNLLFAQRDCRTVPVAQAANRRAKHSIAH